MLERPCWYGFDCEITRHALTKLPQYIKRSPNVSSVQRLKFYARFIRHIQLGQEGSPDLGVLDSEVLKALAPCFQTQKLFPNLLTLTVAETEHERLEDIHLFLGEKLTAFVLQFSAKDCDEKAGAELLKTLQERSPHIENLEIGACVLYFFSLLIAHVRSGAPRTLRLCRPRYPILRALWVIFADSPALALHCPARPSCTCLLSLISAFLRSVPARMAFNHSLPHFLSLLSVI